MKKLLFGTMLLALVIVVPIPTMAAVDIRISFPLPPPIVFPAPPELKGYLIRMSTLPLTLM